MSVFFIQYLSILSKFQSSYVMLEKEINYSFLEVDDICNLQYFIFD